MWNCFALHQTDHYQQANFMKISKNFFPKVQKMTLTFFFSMFCSLSGISLSWKTLVFGRFTSQERTNVYRTAFFLHTPDFSLPKVTAVKVVWGKDTCAAKSQEVAFPRVSRRRRHFANVGDVIIYPDLVVARTDKEKLDPLFPAD